MQLPIILLRGFFGTKTASVDAGADARDTAAAFNLVSSTTGVKATAISKARLATTFRKRLHLHSL